MFDSQKCGRRCIHVLIVLVLIQGVQCKEYEVKKGTPKNDMFVGVGEMLKSAPLRVYFSLLKQ